MFRIRRSLLLLSPALLGCTAPRSDSGPLTSTFEQYRVDRFDEITGLRYTFHAQLGTKQLARQWEWEPESGRVVASSPEEDFGAVVYFREAEGSETTRALDALFVNDQYWLLFPVHLERDAGLDFSEGGIATGPVTESELRVVTAQYGPTGGYTPGDAYDLYLDEDGVIREWVYRRGGSDEPTRSARWGEPVPLGPLRAVLRFDGPDPEAFRVWFSDVAVRVAGDDDWRVVDL